MDEQVSKGSRVVLNSPYGRLVISGGKPEYESVPNGTLGEVVDVSPKGGGYVVDFPAARVLVPTHWVRPEGQDG